MPIIRKILDIGTASKAIILPKSWLEFYESETGQTITLATIEVNQKLIVEPYVKKKPKNKWRGG